MWLLLLFKWMKSLSVITQMKASEQTFPLVLFVMLYKVLLSFECVASILLCDYCVVIDKNVLVQRNELKQLIFTVWQSLIART